MDRNGAREAVRVASPEAMTLADIARQYAEHGRTGEARVLLEGLVVLEPGVAYLHTALGCVLRQLQQDEDALAQFEAALGLDARDTAARTYAGELRLERGEREKARHYLEAATALDPEGKDPYANRARVLLAREEREARPAAARR
jgi:Flp pilus assembly protein TadD